MGKYHEDSLWRINVSVVLAIERRHTSVVDRHKKWLIIQEGCFPVWFETVLAELITYAEAGHRSLILSRLGIESMDSGQQTKLGLFSNEN